MKRFFIYPVLLLIGISCGKQDTISKVERIDNLISGLVEKNQSVGIAFSISVNDTLKLQKEYGLVDLDTDRSVHRESQFRIASITKTLTATAIMQLRDKGMLDLEESIDKYFPQFPKGDQITIYQLLSHTSGIPNWWEGELPKDAPGNFPMCDQPHRYLEKMKTAAFFEPGTHYYYSNSGYVLLGEIIEIVSEGSYMDYIRTHILNPAKMEGTEMEVPHTSQPSNWTEGYVWAPDAKPPFSKARPFSNAMPYSAGGLRSTSTDMMNFILALKAGKLLKESSVEEMMNYAKLNNGQPVHEKLFSPGGDEIRFPDNIKKFGYGMGFQIVENYGTKVVFHGGDIAGFNAFLFYVPKSNTSLVIMSNTENGIMPHLQQIEKTLTSIELSE